MLEYLFDGGPLLRRTRLHALLAQSVGSSTERQPVSLFAVGDPAGFRLEPELLLHPLLDFLISGGLPHEPTLPRFGRITKHTVLYVPLIPAPIPLVVHNCAPAALTPLRCPSCLLAPDPKRRQGEGTSWLPFCPLEGPEQHAPGAKIGRSEPRAHRVPEPARTGARKTLRLKSNRCQCSLYRGRDSS